MTAGTAQQRTDLAVTRTALAVASIAAVLVRVGLVRDQVIDIAGGALAVALAAFVVLARRRVLRIRLTAASTVVIAAVVVVQVLAQL